jgi:hypothetical protein
MKRQTKQFSVIFIFFLLTACATTAPVKTPVNAKAINNQFQSVWKQVTSDPVKKLPQDKVSYSRLFSGGKDIITRNSRRTLDTHANILPSFNKLAHPNGVCLKGVWNIYADNKYSGYFKKNSKALIIVRASSAMSNTRRGEIRSFGFAGKIFPTMNPLHNTKENTANFFLIDDLGGTRAEHYTDVIMSNEPSISKNSEVFKNLLYVAKIASAFSKSDKNPKIRQVYEISQLGETNNIITPQWMKVQAKPNQTVDALDFRDELRIDNNNNSKLVFNISVASKKIQGKKDWKDIGTISLDASVVSTSCDHRLHFHHPKWRANLVH